MRYNPRRIMGSVRRRLKSLGQKRHYRINQPIIKHQVLFVSFEGKVTADSPLDVFHELRTQHSDWVFLWTVAADAKAPEGAVAVTYESKEWLAALAQSQFLVSNNLLPWYFKKSEGQTYLQTWHGTPLKRLANDIETGGVSSTYLANINRESAAWDYLVSPSDFATRAFRSAFGFTGEILEFGYPRNDRLAQQTVSRQSLCEKIGISDPGKKLVLYAPTWRDYRISASGEWEAFNYLSPDLQLPDGYQLLFRGHSATLGTHDASIAGNAIDVTRYPDITELLLVADVLVTDFSSTMFDFSITGKPILFFAPDFERYQNERGFYFDFEAISPGPIYRDQEQLLTGLSKLSQLQTDYRERYYNWQQKFNKLEVGTAAHQVVNAVFSKA